VHLVEFLVPQPAGLFLADRKTALPGAFGLLGFERLVQRDQCTG
jgi:hypothetical protein